MALETVRRSDVSGKPIAAGTGARVRIMFADPEKPDRRADLTDAEVDKLLSFAEEVVPRPNRRGGDHSRFSDDVKDTRRFS